MMQQIDKIEKTWDYLSYASDVGIITQRVALYLYYCYLMVLLIKNLTNYDLMSV